MNNDATSSATPLTATRMRHRAPHLLRIAQRHFGEDGRHAQRIHDGQQRGENEQYVANDGVHGVSQHSRGLPGCQLRRARCVDGWLADAV